MPWKRWLFRLAAGGFVLAVLATVIGIAVAWVPMGTAPDGARAERMAASDNSVDGVFVNPQPMWNDYWGSITAAFEMSDYAVPEEPLPVVEDAAGQLSSDPQGARVTWLGHSTTLIEVGGRSFLTDPIFGPSTTPIPALGPQRWYAPPIPLEQLADIDAVLVSHDHYDHLDHSTIERMATWDTTFVAPLGVGAHLEYWGIPSNRIVELDWWEETMVGDVRVVATPARHASGRHAFDQNRTLWAGYAVIGPEHRLMFSGDTGLFDDLETIGEKYGPFDLVMIEVGAYHRAWPDWHIGPEQAIEGHQMMRGEVFMPIHWGLFNLALHGWTEPVERTWVAATTAAVPFVTPRPGESFEVDDPPDPTRWWPDVPWQTAADHPIRSTKNGDPDVRY